MEEIAIDGTGKPTGSNPETPYALVLLGMDSAGDLMKIPARHGNAPQYLYYRLFTRVGEDVSKTAFNTSTPALGRIEILRICPPHDPESVKRCIAKVDGKEIYAPGDLFENIGAERMTSTVRWTRKDVLAHAQSGLWCS
ncbi:hypothetical protein B0H14DRAFT_3633102 [Mycena olivaceomarginata]|nr:hypothetical protein B0H14DRAFT_3633102 [Mycena olivaceomarginata]